ncbi:MULTISPECIES: ATP synthase subunit I [Geobacillus]|uniref:ATP synthase protein I n=3 Tax=Bacillales TaxID=1385 RepID=ATPZ_BACP3|nr:MULTISPECIES: ATP synthase subunit I [Geobacillus]P09354.1 RecName: Full=ATP synthase protein I [Bacillus sp. PS3]pir/S01397/ H+-transporting two-sector ATPase (EC 3.6.3.14) chain I - thermophilic bacterium PS-3 [Bacillus sp. PS3]QHN50683.1 ATP synthase subunit I [Geobacillus stearothermophilus]AGE23950.1 ATP synthase protein I [Geobacillus sp. GHH01]AMQ21885.1 ATP synthase I [Geobacillus sp. JS12]AUI36997.1 ATP synthase subunit I [[Bacillus] caldolyticus]EPR27992.1 ATP synthase protein I
MGNLQAMFWRQVRYILYLLAIYTLGFGFTPYKTVFLSLILGTSISLLMVWNLTWKIEKFGQAVAARKKVRTLGTLSRLALAALAAVIVLTYPQYFHIVPTVLGLMTSYIVIIIDFFFHKWKNDKLQA